MIWNGAAGGGGGGVDGMPLRAEEEEEEEVSGRTYMFQRRRFRAERVCSEVAIDALKIQAASLTVPLEISVRLYFNGVNLNFIPPPPPPPPPPRARYL